MAQRSVFIDTPLQEYLLASDNQEERETVFENAVKAFRAETAEALLLFDMSKGGEYTATRAESIRGYIVKLLLYIGLFPKNSNFSVIARLIEYVANRPDAGLDVVLQNFANTYNTTVMSISRMIEKYLCAYDSSLIEKVVRITNSDPMTAKDVLCDLAVHVRLKYNTEKRNA